MPVPAFQRGKGFHLIDPSSEEDAVAVAVVAAGVAAIDVAALVAVGAAVVVGGGGGCGDSDAGVAAGFGGASGHAFGDGLMWSLWR